MPVLGRPRRGGAMARRLALPSYWPCLRQSVEPALLGGAPWEWAAIADLVPITGRPGVVQLPTSSSSTSKVRVALGGITPPAPRSP
jgi:hypothetical protein